MQQNVDLVKMGKTYDIAISGAGIGGLTAAIALADAGHRVVVYEAAREIKPLGVGINVLPHAVDVLSAHGMGNALAANAVATESLVFMNRFGQLIYRDPRGLAGGYGSPQYSIHRGALHNILIDAARLRGSNIEIRANARVVRAESFDDHVRLSFADASVADSRSTADVFVAADGIHSAIRAQYFPHEGAAKWNGMMMWRGVTRAKSFMGGRTMAQAGNRLAKFVVYPIAKPDASGDQLINWICDIRVADGIGGTLTAPSRESWSTPGCVEDLLPTFGHWRIDSLRVGEIIANATQIFEWPMVDRDPLPAWTHGRATLLGDAAHPMYPIGSNGATQAILDAKALADAIQAHANPVEALSAYETTRRPMTANIVRMNRREGLDVILDMVHERAPNGFSRLADVIDPAEISRVVQQYKMAAGHRPAPALAETGK